MRPSYLGLQEEHLVLLCGPLLWLMQVVDAFVRSWAASELRRCLFLGGFSLNCFCIISQPPICATIWIKHLEVAIVASSRIKHGDWIMLVSKKNPQ